MSLTRYQPWGLLSELQNDINRGFARTSDGAVRFTDKEGQENTVIRYDWQPAVDIREEDDRFVVFADIPGVDPAKVEITAEQGRLTLKGERVQERAADGDAVRRSECSYGQFYRRFSLPDTANLEKITASGSNGVLEIVIPKSEQAKPRQIQVKVG